MSMKFFKIEFSLIIELKPRPSCRARSSMNRELRQAEYISLEAECVTGTWKVQIILEEPTGLLESTDKDVCPNGHDIAELGRPFASDIPLRC